MAGKSPQPNGSRREMMNTGEVDDSRRKNTRPLKNAHTLKGT
jgi:hypothetical protein